MEKMLIVRRKHIGNDKGYSFAWNFVYGKINFEDWKIADAKYKSVLNFL